MGQRFTSQLHAEVEDGPWTSVAIWPDDDPYGPINGVIFEVGEPIRLHQSAWGRPTGDIDETTSLTRRIYWIGMLRDGINGHEVQVGKVRGAPTFVTMVGHLRKLEPLHRLAAEASDGPARV